MVGTISHGAHILYFCTVNHFSFLSKDVSVFGFTFPFSLSAHLFSSGYSISPLSILDWKNLPPTALADLTGASLAHTCRREKCQIRRQNRCKFRADTTLYPLERVGAVLRNQKVRDDVVADQIPLRGSAPAAGIVLGRLIVAAALFQYIFQRGEGQQGTAFRILRALMP